MPEVRVLIPNDLDRALDALIRAGFAGNKAELARAAITHFLSTIPTQLQKGYDLETSFAPDGRVFQLEYARESMKKGGTIVGVCSTEGVVLAKEVATNAPLTVIPNPFLRIFKVHENIGIAYCGILTDGYLVVEEAVRIAESFKDSIDIEVLARKLALFMQPYGQRKDVRPFAVALILGGIDSKKRPRLFQLNSAGFALEFKACTVGAGSEESEEILRTGHKQNMSLEESISLAIKAALREKKEPEDVIVATISAKTREFKEITLEEKERMWKKIFP